MPNQDIQLRYNTLKQSLETKKLAKARTEANIEQLTINRDREEKKLLELSQVKTVAEVGPVIAAIENELTKLLDEAEALLKEVE